MKKIYETYIFEKDPDWDKVPEGQITQFFWEQDGYSRPESYFKLCAVREKGIFARLRSFEENRRCVCTERDGRIWCDSCLEVFLAPVNGDTRYINFETNPAGAFLSQLGPVRENRVFIKELTDISPEITPFLYTENGRECWGNEIFIPNSLISTLYGINYSPAPGEIKGNFYKCADESVSPHYGAFFEVDDASLGFHNPEKFGTIKFEKAE